MQARTEIRPSEHVLARTWARLKSRPDSEHEQAIVRFVIVGVLTAFVLWRAALDQSPGHGFGALIYLGLGYLAFSVVYFLSIVYSPQPSPMRRVSAMITDFAALTALLQLGGEAAAPFYPVYLWVSFGYGFRYGLRDLARAVAASVVGFSFVVLTTEYWRQELPLAIGLLAALIVLPAYTASLIKKLIEAKAQAEAASQAKSRFLASVSHDLRTPLNAVIGISELIGHTPLNRDQKDMIHTIKTSGGALLSLIDGILDLSKIEAGRISVDAETFDLHREMADLVAILRPEARQKGLRLGVNISPRVPADLRGDVRHLRQILTNLTANAVKFTNDGYVLIRVEAAAEVTDTRVPLRFEVVDTGIGIPEEDQDRIFDRFTQSNEAADRRNDGAGLGLAITKSLTELLNGTIGVRSEMGNGSVFWVEVAFARQTPSTAREAAEPVKIFLISDDTRSAGEVRQQFRDSGMDVVELTDWRSDIQLLVDTEEPAVVVVDDRVQGTDPAIIADALAAGRCGHGLSLIRIVSDHQQPVPDPNFVATLQPPLDHEVLVNAVRAAHACSFSGAASMIDADLHAEQGPSPHGLTILVAEDNPINRKITARILQHGGHGTRVVSSGDEALECLQEEVFDVMIVDINMPGTNGIDVVKLCRMAEGSSEHLPIIVVSADATPETSRACEEAGADVYLTKPVEARRLLDAVRTTHDRFEGKPASVTRISTHPRFRGDVVPAVDWTALSNLQRLAADDGFLVETLREYLVDSQTLIRDIGDAVAAVDPQAFREGIHALRGTSGNVGAQALRQACEEITGITRTDLVQRGNEYIQRLERELTRFATELSRNANLSDLSSAL